MGDGRWAKDELTPSLSSVEGTRWRETAKGGREARQRLLEGSTGEKRGMEQVWNGGVPRGRKRQQGCEPCVTAPVGSALPCFSDLRHPPTTTTAQQLPHHRTTAPPHHDRAPDATCSASKTDKGQAEGSTKASDTTVDKQTPRPALDTSCVQALKPSANTRCAASRWRGGVSAWMSAHRAAQSPSCGRAGGQPRLTWARRQETRAVRLTEQPPEPPPLARMQMEIARGLGV